MKATSLVPARVMAGVKELRARLERELLSPGEKPTLAALGIVAVTEVRELPPTSVMTAIEDIFAEAASSILAEQGFQFEVPNRTASNQLYVPELDRIVLKDKKSTRSFDSTAQVRKTVIMTRVMDMLHQVLRRNIHTTKRDLFYADVKLFKSQDESDAVLDDVACVVGCTRTSLHVVASEKGVVVGRVTFREGEVSATPPHCPENPSTPPSQLSHFIRHAACVLCMHRVRSAACFRSTRHGRGTDSVTVSSVAQTAI